MAPEERVDSQWRWATVEPAYQRSITIDDAATAFNSSMEGVKETRTDLAHTNNVDQLVDGSEIPAPVIL